MEQGLQDTFAAIDSGDSQKLFGMISQSDRNRAQLTEDKLAKLLSLYKKETAGSSPGPIAISGDTHYGNASVVLRKDGREVANLLICYVTNEGTEKGAAVSYGLIAATCMARAHQEENHLNSANELNRSIAAGLSLMAPELRSIGIDKSCGTNPAQPCEPLDQYQERLLRLANRKP